jgi:hypothetical protein
MDDKAENTPKSDANDDIPVVTPSFEKILKASEPSSWPNVDRTSIKPFKP